MASGTKGIHAPANNQPAPHRAADHHPAAGVVVLTSIAVFWVMQRQAEHQFSLLLQAALHNRVQFMQSELDGAVAGTDGTNTAQ